jgi:hypothetical protein
MALGKTAKYYKLNPEARKKKAATDKKINSRSDQKAKRAELARINYANDKRNGKDSRKCKDYDHATGKYENVKTNRGRKGEGNR